MLYTHSTSLLDGYIPIIVDQLCMCRGEVKSLLFLVQPLVKPIYFLMLGQITVDSLQFPHSPALQKSKFH